MALEDMTLIWLGNQLIITPPDTELAPFLLETRQLWLKHPEILTKINADLDQRGLDKKRVRVAMQRHYEEKNPEIITDDPRCVVEEKLDGGRPRMDARVALTFLMLRGLYGSICSANVRGRFYDSLCMRVFLVSYCKELPQLTTILENVNAVSNSTREYILDCQMGMVRDDGLDDFKIFLGDSTAVWANSEWPTDSFLIWGWLSRAFKISQRLEVFGLSNFPLWHVPRWLSELKQLDFQLNMTVGKKRGRQRRKTLYTKYCKKAAKVIDCLGARADEWQIKVDAACLPPVQAMRLQALWEELEHCLSDAYTIMLYCQDRTQNSGPMDKREDHEQLFSLSDRSARFIKKGGRETVFGYKPQLGQSRNGLVTALLIEEGNPADSKRLEPLLEEHIRRVGITPSTVTVDDGYASAAGFKAALVIVDNATVSINGSKGRKVVGDKRWESEDYQEARRLRGLAESPISTLKRCREFGRLRRRGIKGVRAELLEKILAYNCLRIGELRKRQQAEAAKKLAAAA